MKIEGSRIFVTGGSGFIGSHIVEELLNLGASITIYDNFSTGNPENLDNFSNNIHIIEGDILDFQKLKKVMKYHDIVSHHAAQLEIFLSQEDPIQDLTINTVGTLNVLRAAYENNVGKVINASSACIYGQTEFKTKENDLPLPNWAYGVSKLAAENYCSIYNQYHHLPVVSLRYGITYGEREWFRRAATIFIKRAILNEPLVIFGDGKQIRDFVYVRDVVRLHNICIEAENGNGQTYNAGSGIPVTILELANLVSGVSETVLHYKPSIVFEEIQEGDFSRLVPDKKRNIAELKTMSLNTEKACKELGWKPITSLREGIRKEMIWATKNLHRWKKVNYSSSMVYFKK